MTDYTMLLNLLRKSGRMFDTIKHPNKDKMIVQIHIADMRYQWEFDSNTGELIEEWENSYEDQWISNGWGRYYT